MECHSTEAFWVPAFQTHTTLLLRATSLELPKFKKYSCEQIYTFFNAGKTVEQIAQIKRTEGSNLGLVCIAGI